MKKGKVMTGELLAELAMIAESQDPIDWGMLTIDEKQAFELMASQVLEQTLQIPVDDRLPAMMACLTAVLVENFVLNLHLSDCRRPKEIIH